MGDYVNTSAWQPSYERTNLELSLAVYEFRDYTVQKSKLRRTQCAIIYQVYYDDNRNADAAAVMHPSAKQLKISSMNEPFPMIHIPLKNENSN